VEGEGTLTWYREASGAASLPPRCPFAALDRCPRYYEGVALLGESGLSTRIPLDEDERLLTMWKSSDLWPRTAEAATSISGPADDPRHFMSFCPEVLFDRFGWFATNLHRYADETDHDIASRQLTAVGAQRSDWRWHWSSMTAMHYADCPLYSPLSIGGAGLSTTNATSSDPHTDLDPFRPVMSLVDDSDVLVSAALAGGLVFDSVLTGDDAYSHKTRVRALRPRILAAYDGLNGGDQLTAARAFLGAVLVAKPAMKNAIDDALQHVGWALSDGDLAVKTPNTREVFFPRGSQWDAFVVLRDLLGKAKAQIAIVDAYCNSVVFQLLQERELNGITIRILCSKYADSVSAAAKAFVAQHGGASVEIRQTGDFHDRFVVLDDAVCIHIGASIKDAGRTAFMISQIEDDANRAAMLKQLNDSWAAGTPVP
jgi:hypothetical protein